MCKKAWIWYRMFSHFMYVTNGWIQGYILCISIKPTLANSHPGLEIHYIFPREHIRSKIFSFITQKEAFLPFLMQFSPFSFPPILYFLFDLHFFFKQPFRTNHSPTTIEFCIIYTPGWLLSYSHFHHSSHICIFPPTAILPKTILHNIYPYKVTFWSHINFSQI